MHGQIISSRHRRKEIYIALESREKEVEMVARIIISDTVGSGASTETAVVYSFIMETTDLRRFNICSAANVQT